jgi:Transposase and inactivated derivatives
MAGTIINMSKIKQLLQLHRQGVSNRKIASLIGINRETVGDYIKKVKHHGFDLGSLLQMEDPALEKLFSSGNPAYTENRFLVLKEKLSYIEKELKKPGVTRHLLWEEYLTEHPEGYRYSQFCYHLNQLIIARHPSAVLEHVPGEKLYIDFAGHTLPYVDRETGEIIHVQVFVACLPCSDYTFVMAVPSQATDDLLYALSCCLEHLGGSPKIVVSDNLKSAVIKTDRYEPDLNRVMEDFANHYGFVVLPARPYKPKDKAAVENQVKITYNRVYARLRNELFFSIEELNKAIFEKVKNHNQTRMQQKPYSREEKFLADEKVLLKQLPEKPFEIKYYTHLRVATNNCIYLGRDKHYYSVPYTYIGREVKVIYTRTIVCIYLEGVCIATHQRTIGFGYTTVKEHLCSTHRHYMSRSPEYYIGQAKKRSEALARLIKRNFEGEDIPERIYRRCDGLLSLQRKTDPVVFEKACLYALEADAISYKSLQRIIENKTYEWSETNKEEPAERTSHENIRGKEYYTNHLKQTS